MLLTPCISHHDIVWWHEDVEMPSASWWCHQMETFSALLALCAGNSPVTGEFPVQRPVTRSFDVFCDLRLNKRLSKQSLGWWFDMPSSPLWRHSNDAWPYVKGIHQSPVYSPKKRSVSRLTGSLLLPEHQYLTWQLNSIESVCQLSESLSQYWIPRKQITYHTSQKEGTPLNVGIWKTQ